MLLSFLILGCSPNRPQWITDALLKQRQAKTKPSIKKTSKKSIPVQTKFFCHEENIPIKNGIEICHINKKVRHRRLLSKTQVLEEKFFVQDALGQKLLDSVFTQFHPNGNLSQGSFYKRGKKHGPFELRNKAGNTLYQSRYWRGLQDGKSNRWDDQGRLLEEAFWVRGVRHGQETIWDKEGYKFKETPYHDGLIHGTHYLWKKERVLIKISYNLGQLDGSSEQYWPNGKLKQIVPYKQGHIHGQVKNFFNSSKRQNTIPYLNGKRHGVAKGWFENGKKDFMLKYSNGHREGVSKVWSKTGRILKKRHWNSDKLQGYQVDYHPHKKTYKYENDICISDQCIETIEVKPSETNL
jgi:antitoxin component YwqK of YwqJK toxin-antitoxin module